MSQRSLLLSVALAATGCSPTLNWREVQPADSGLVAMFPCKPSHEEREVPLAGRPVRLAVAACRAEDAMYAVAYGDVADPARVGSALDGLRNAAMGNVKASSSAQRQLAVPGMTPHPQAQALELRGQMPDGRAVLERVAVFSKGTRVFQATMLGDSLPPEAVETFFGGLRLP